MKIIYGSTGQTETLTMSQLTSGKVYTDVSDVSDDDLYLKTDGSMVVSLRDGMRLVDDDMPTARFLEVDVELVVKK